MLKGEEGFAYDYNYTSRLYTKFQLENKNLLLDDAERFQIKISNIVTGLEYVKQDESNSIRYGHSDHGRHVTQVPVQLSLKIPDTVCFTRPSKVSHDTLRKYDLMGFNSSIFGNGKYKSVKFQIFIHHPNQLLRSFHRPAFKSTFGYMKDKNDHSKRAWTKFLRIAISKVTVLRTRPNSNVPCDPHLQNDDEKLQTKIIKHIGCIPIYWKNNVGTDLNMNICKTSKDLQKAYHYIENYKTVFATYSPPCISAEVRTEFDMLEENESEDPKIQFLYRETVYEEITNTESFNFESFISGVGGFAGIFLGYSILQLPELLSLLPTFFRKLKVAFKKGTL